MIVRAGQLDNRLVGFCLENVGWLRSRVTTLFTYMLQGITLRNWINHMSKEHLKMGNLIYNGEHDFFWDFTIGMDVPSRNRVSTNNFTRA